MTIREALRAFTFAHRYNDIRATAVALVGADSDSAVRSFAFAIESVERQADRLGVDAHRLRVFGTERAENIRVRDMPRKRLQVGLDRLNVLGSALAVRFEAERQHDPQLDSLLTRFEHLAYGAPEGGGTKKEWRTWYDGLHGAAVHAQLLIQERLAGVGDRSVRIGDQRIAAYSAAEAMRAPAFWSESVDFAKFMDDGSEAPDTPGPFDDVLVMFRQPLPRELGDRLTESVEVAVANDVEEHIGFLFLQGAQPLAVRRFGQVGDDGRMMVLRPATADAERVVRNFLMHSQVKEKQPELPASSRTAFGSSSSQDVVRVVKNGSWRQSVERAVEAASSGRSVDAHDRRGAWVRYPLDSYRLQAMGIQAKEGAEHFWIGWRSDTRVNDPEYKRSGRRPLEPDTPMQVRAPVPGRPDLPDSFALNDVFSVVTAPGGGTAYEKVGVHPRASQQQARTTHLRQSVSSASLS